MDKTIQFDLRNYVSWLIGKVLANAQSDTSLAPAIIVPQSASAAPLFSRVHDVTRPNISNYQVTPDIRMNIIDPTISGLGEHHPLSFQSPELAWAEWLYLISNSMARPGGIPLIRGEENKDDIDVAILIAGELNRLNTYDLVTAARYFAEYDQNMPINNRFQQNRTILDPINIPFLYRHNLSRILFNNHVFFQRLLRLMEDFQHANLSISWLKNGASDQIAPFQAAAVRKFPTPKGNSAGRSNIITNLYSTESLSPAATDNDSNATSLLMAQNDLVLDPSTLSNASNIISPTFMIDKPNISLNHIVIDVNSLAGIDTTGSKDDTSIINQAISAVPAGATIDLIFSGGTYELEGTVILPSNTNVIGNNATIVTNAASQISNTLSQFSNQEFNGNGAALNTQISVVGLTFVYPVPIWNIAIWFQNVQNVNISDNTFIAANNGDIGVLNGTNVVIAGNLAVGNINGAYNGWNGLQNVSVDNNSDYQSGSAAGSGGYWFNGTYNAGGVNQGSQNNSYLINNINAGVLPGGAAFGIGPLNYGYTTLMNANMQGNLFAANSTPSTFGFLELGPGFYNVIEANIVSQYVSGNPEQTMPFNSSGSGAGTLAALGNAIIGNEVFGSTNSLSNFLNQGDASTTANDIVLLAQDALEFAALVGVEDLNALAPIVVGVGGAVGTGTVTNGPVPLGITVSGSDNLILTPSIASPVPGIAISDASTLGNKAVTLEISDIFGTLSINGQSGSTVDLSGSIELINEELKTLSYTPNGNSWNDDIHFSATDATGNRAVWDIAVGFTTASSLGGQGIGTFSAANSTNPPATIIIPVNGIPLPAPLGGDTLVVQGGGHLVTMGGSITMVFTGAGSNLIEGGADPGYIQTNTGPTQVTLSEGGDFTVSGGVGGINVAAISGNDLIQSASGPIQATLGVGADTVLSGIGPASVDGGSGFALVASLPEYGGLLDVTLGVGGGVVYALSGTAAISTASGGRDTVFGGQGTVDVLSNGSDLLYGGSGMMSVVGGLGSSDTILGGSGTTSFQAGGGNSYIAAGSGQTEIHAGSGNLVVSAGANCSLTVASLPGTTRSIAVAGPAVIDLVGYGSNPIVSENLTQSTLTMKLSDGTNIVITDPANEFGFVNQGVVTLSGIALSGTGSAEVIPYTTGNLLELTSSSSTLSGAVGSGNFSSIEVDQSSVLTIDSLSANNNISQITVLGKLIDIQTNLSLTEIQLTGGTIQIDPATLTTNDLRGIGTVVMDGNTSLSISGTVESGVTIDFSQSAAIIDIATLANLSGVIAGFSVGAGIDFVQSGQLTDTYQMGVNGFGTLAISNSTTTIGDLQFSNPSFSSASFVINNLGSGIEQIAVSCFVTGTPIRSRGLDVPVERLRIGDYVDTQDGRSVPIKWIGRRRLCGSISAEDFPIVFPRGSLGRELPTSELQISSDHGFFIGGLLIPAGLLCNKVIRKIDPGDTITFYHIECEKHELILAAGVAVESFLDLHSREGFDNFYEYQELYGAGLAPPVTECAPRVVAGELACSAILNAFGAKHFYVDEIRDESQLGGHVDEATATYVTGWAAASSGPALVEISVNNRVKGYAHACDFRADLRDANIGDGYAAFRFEFAEPIETRVTSMVSVRIVGSKYVLNGSPKRIPPSDGPYSGNDSISVLAITEALAKSTRSSLISRSADNRPIALVLDESEPDPNRDAGSEAILCYTRTLRDIGYRVLFAVTHGIRSPESVRAIKAAGGEVVQAAGCTAVEAILSTLVVDLVLLHRPIVVVAYAGLVRARAPNCKVVMAVADLEHIRFEALWHVVGHKHYREQQAIARRRLDQAVHLVDQILTHSLSERSWLRAHFPDKKIDMLLWTPTAKKAETPFEQRTGAGFVGSMGHAPNLDALYWIDQEIEPKLRAKKATFPINIIGSQFQENLYLMERDGMHFAGLAQNLSESLSDLRITVAPLRTGAGVKGKVLSSFCAGVPCVMTSVAADGLDLPADLMALVADDAEGIATRMIYIHDDRPSYDQISKICVEWAREHLGAHEIKRQMEAFLFASQPELSYVPRNLDFTAPQSRGQRVPG